MPKKNPKPNKALYQTITEEDFEEYAISAKARRAMKLRRGLRLGFLGLAMLISLAVGFTAMEAMLLVSETPLPEEIRVTEPEIVTTEPLPELPEPQGEPMRSFYIPINMLDRREQSAQLQAQARSLGTNTAVMTFKDANGWLTYRSNLIQMDLLRANTRARHRTDWTKFDMIRRADQRVMAVIHTFDDPLAAGLMSEAAVLRYGTNEPWADNDGNAWLNPWSELARTYLLGVIREVAAFGQQGATVDYILLRGVTFPAGNLNAAYFPGGDHEDPQARNTVLRSFIEEAAQAAGEATLIVMVPRAGAENAEALGGDLWDSAAEMIAIDTRGTTAAHNEGFWRTRHVIPVVESHEDGEDLRDFIVLIDEAQ